MYTQVNILPRVNKIAEKFVLDNDRLLYRDFFRLIEEYAAERKIIIGGPTGSDLLLKRAFNKDNFTYDLYVDNVWTCAKEIADLLYKSGHTPHVDKTTINCETIVKNVEAMVHVNLRPIVRLSALPHVRGGNIRDIIRPVHMHGHFAEKELPCLPGDLYLIDVYRKLYRPYPPMGAQPYSDLLSLEDSLFALAKSRLGDIGNGKTGGFAHEEDEQPVDPDVNEVEDETVVQPEDQDAVDDLDDFVEDVAAEDDVAAAVTGGVTEAFRLNWRQNAEKIILEEVLRGSNYVLVGDYALKDIGLDATNSRLQFLAGDDITEYVAKIGNALRKNNVHSKLEYVKYNLQLPNDFQTTKYTIYAIDHLDKRVSLLDVFNTLSFEMVPFTLSKSGPLAGIRVGGLFVQLRFKFVDLWSMHFVLSIGGQLDAAKTRIEDIKRQIVTTRDTVLKKIANDPVSVFQLDNYAGVFIDEFVAKKKIIGTERFRFQRYYPAAGDREPTSESE